MIVRKIHEWCFLFLSDIFAEFLFLYLERIRVYILSQTYRASSFPFNELDVTWQFAYEFSYVEQENKLKYDPPR